MKRDCERDAEQRSIEEGGDGGVNALPALVLPETAVEEGVISFRRLWLF